MVLLSRQVCIVSTSFFKPQFKQKTPAWFERLIAALAQQNEDLTHTQNNLYGQYGAHSDSYLLQWTCEYHYKTYMKNNNQHEWAVKLFFVNLLQAWIIFFISHEKFQNYAYLFNSEYWILHLGF